MEDVEIQREREREKREREKERNCGQKHIREPHLVRITSLNVDLRVTTKVPIPILPIGQEQKKEESTEGRDSLPYVNLAIEHCHDHPDIGQDRKDRCACKDAKIFDLALFSARGDYTL